MDIGFTVPPENGELADHLSVELAFLAELCSREAKALASGDQDTSNFAACMQDKFLTAHAGRWPKPFSNQVAEKAQMPFYPAIADFLASFIGSEMAERAELVD